MDLKRDHRTRIGFASFVLNVEHKKGNIIMCTCINEQNSQVTFVHIRFTRENEVFIVNNDLLPGHVNVIADHSLFM